jgi:acetyl-CoA carboxylase biotin carboxyl carrier protein
MSHEIEIRTDTAGTLLRIVAAPNTPLEAGDDIAIMESMKMEIPLQAPAAGSVVEFLFEEGAALDEDAVVARFVAS